MIGEINMCSTAGTIEVDDFGKTVAIQLGNDWCFSVTRAQAETLIILLLRMFASCGDGEYPHKSYVMEFGGE